MRVGGLRVVALQFDGTVDMVTGCGQLASLCENQRQVNMSLHQAWVEYKSSLKFLASRLHFDKAAQNDAKFIVCSRRAWIQSHCLSQLFNRFAPNPLQGQRCAQQYSCFNIV